MLITFLFNSLNILYSLTEIDLDKSRRFILNLSDMYRQLLSRQQMSTVKVADDLRFMQSYIEVLRIRYEGCLDIAIIRDAFADDREIIPFSLQILTENITKHNTIRRSNPLTIEIRLAEEGIFVQNPIYPKVSDRGGESAGVGLSYLSKVYAQYGRQFRSECRDGKFIVFVPYL